MKPTPFPLCWPEGVPRAKRRQDARFKVADGKAIEDLYRAADLMRLSGVVLSTNVEPRLDGRPRANQAAPRDPGAVLYAIHAGAETVIACDRYNRVGANIRAIGLTLDALRSIKRWGSSEMLEGALRGFQALPGPTAGAERRPDWWTVLSVPREVGREILEPYCRTLLSAHHPDKGGDPETFTRVRLAIEDMRAEKGAVQV